MTEYWQYLESLKPEPPRMTEADWIEMFKGSAKDLNRIFKNQIAEAEAEIREINSYKLKVRQQLTRFDQQWFLAVARDEADRAIKTLEKRIKKYKYLISLLNGKQQHPARGITDRDIETAKEVPLDQFLDSPVRQSGQGRITARCPFHRERTPSFVIYPSNTWHCFGACSTGGDAIDFMMKRDNLKFTEAVKQLCNSRS